MGVKGARAFRWFDSLWWGFCLRVWCGVRVAPEGVGDGAFIGFERCILSWVMAFLDWRVSLSIFLNEVF